MSARGRLRRVFSRRASNDNQAIVRPDSSYYEEIAGRLRGLLIRLSDRPPAKDLTLIDEFIDGNELGLALEQMADVLCEDGAPVSRDERTDMLALVDRMMMDDRVAGALALCPIR